MLTEQPEHDQLQLLLEICEDFFRRTSPATRSEVDLILLDHGITGGPGWLIDMLGLTRQHLQSRAFDTTIKTHDGD
jgi:hypothetical protein